MSSGALIPPIAFIVAALVCAAVTAIMLPWLRRVCRTQSVREDVPESHQQKAGTPSMGGIPMLLSVVLVGVIVGLATGNLSLRLGLCLAVATGFAVVGLLDDVHKLSSAKSKGILARWRIAAEVLLSAAFVAGLTLDPGATIAPVSWFGSAGWPVAVSGAFAVFVIVGGANALNLTDGLDGLASGLTAVAAVALSAICVCLGMMDLAIACVCLAGGAAGFLLHNAKPAKVWMGDVGSLGLGAILAAIAVAGRIEFIFALAGLVFVAEALSVILQVISFQSTGKRIFRMAPLHHHFELGGLKETQVVGRFWLAGAIAGAAGVAAFYLTPYAG